MRPAGNGLLGLTVVALIDGQILEVDAQRKIRWRLSGFQGISDVQVLPRNHLLVAEMHSGRVSERGPKNEIVWQKQVNSPLSCQRLPNGNTFIALRNQLLEVSREGKEVFSYNRQVYDIAAAQRLRNGETLFLTQSAQCVRLDAQGKEVKSFVIGDRMLPLQPTTLQVLPNGNILVAHQYLNKVIEYDPAGKAVWESSVIQRPQSAQRLPNGHTLIASGMQNQVVEIDRTGKAVWDYTPTTRVARAVRR